MKFVLPAIILGFVANLFLLKPETGIEIYPEWTGSIKNVGAIEKSIHKSAIKSPVVFPLKNAGTVHILTGSGAVKYNNTVKDSLVSVSGNGLFYITYKKVGKEIEFFNTKGDRFWKMKTREYPHLSYNAQLIALMVGDHSRVRIADYNGNILSTKPLYGRLCTVISFSPRGANAGIGFIDGSYYIINNKGKTVYQDSAPGVYIVKGIAVSNNGKSAVVHYGDEDHDYIRIITPDRRSTVNIQKLTIAKKARHSLPHITQTAMYITNSGKTTFLDRNKILQFDSNGNLDFYIVIRPARDGAAFIDYADGYYGVTYTQQTGDAKFLLFREDQVLVYSKEFPGESYAFLQMKKGFIYLRGTDNVYCYRLHLLPKQ